MFSERAEIDRSDSRGDSADYFCNPDAPVLRDAPSPNTTHNRRRLCPRTGAGNEGREQNEGNNPVRPPENESSGAADGMRGCSLFSDTTAVIFNAAPTPAPAPQDPRCRVPAASRHAHQTIQRPGSLRYNHVLCPEKTGVSTRAPPVTLTANPRPRARRGSARARQSGILHSILRTSADQSRRGR